MIRQMISQKTQCDIGKLNRVEHVLVFIKGNQGEVRTRVFRVEWIEGWTIDEKTKRTSIYVYVTHVARFLVGWAGLGYMMFTRTADQPTRCSLGNEFALRWRPTY